MTQTGKHDASLYPLIYSSLTYIYATLCAHWGQTVAPSYILLHRPSRLIGDETGVTKSWNSKLKSLSLTERFYLHCLVVFLTVFIPVVFEFRRPLFMRFNDVIEQGTWIHFEWHVAAVKSDCLLRMRQKQVNRFPSSSYACQNLFFFTLKLFIPMQDVTVRRIKLHFLKFIKGWF